MAMNSVKQAIMNHYSALLGAVFLALMPLYAVGGMDDVLNGGSMGGGTSGSSASAARMAAELGKLFESLVLIFGVYYALKSVLIYSRVVSGRGAGQQENMGSVASHFVAGVVAYHSRAFFNMVHNTIPMIPDFGRLVYDAELMMGLMS